jgi:hypothetical protein
MLIICIFCKDPIVSSESTFDGDNEDDSADDKKRTGLFSNLYLLLYFYRNIIILYIMKQWKSKQMLLL